ncbi:hypothetical protein DH2020_047762 [Rehmannia glutinosa]|uniref:Uncharacterized protein n=1 Tax=Rehmannia glutinosa TaxID=99300 RepID=A0ABR0U8N3_REHGL
MAPPHRRRSLRSHWRGERFYDVSIVDGYNLPLVARPELKVDAMSRGVLRISIWVMDGFGRWLSERTSGDRGRRKRRGRYRVQERVRGVRARPVLLQRGIREPDDMQAVVLFRNVQESLPESL